MHSGSCEFILFLSSHLPVLRPLAIDTYFVVYYQGEWKFFFWAIKSTFDAPFLPSQFSPTLLHVTCSRHLNFPLLHTAVLLIHFALTGLLSRLNSADYWICTNYTPKYRNESLILFFPKRIYLYQKLRIWEENESLWHNDVSCLRNLWSKVSFFENLDEPQEKFTSGGCKISIIRSSLDTHLQ